MTRVNIVFDAPHHDMFLWLNKNFGPSGKRWRVVNLSYIDFLDSKDALLFSLRWPV